MKDAMELVLNPIRIRIIQVLSTIETITAEFDQFLSELWGLIPIYQHFGFELVKSIINEETGICQYCFI